MIASQTVAIRSFQLPFVQPPVVSNSSVQFHDTVLLGELAADGPNAIFPSQGLGNQDPAVLGGMKWINQSGGGDYIDASGTLNGTNHFASSAYPNVGPWDVTALVQKMLVDGNTGFHLSSSTAVVHVKTRQSANPPTLAITTTTGTFTPPCIVSCWTDSASSQTFNDTNQGRIGINPITEGAAFLKFDLSGVIGDVTSATLSVTVIDAFWSSGAIRVNYLRMPPLTWDPARQVASGPIQGIAAAVANDLALASHPSVIFYPSFADDTAFNAAGWNRPVNSGSTGHSYVSWPQYGLTAIRWASNTVQPDIAAFERFFGDTYTELYCRYLMKIDTDVYVGMTERGVKLPGLDSSFGNDDANTFSYRMEHLKQCPSNQQAYGYFQHAYDAEHSIAANPSNAQNRPMDVPACLVAGKIYCIEQYVKLNTDNGAGVYNSDGIFRVWIDGVLMRNDTTRKIRSDQIPIFDHHLNFYHGGTGSPSAPIHYEYGGVCVATQYIGPPKKVPQPAWLAGVPVNGWVEIPNTKLSTLVALHPEWSTVPTPPIGGPGGPFGIFKDWSGPSVDTRDSTLWCVAQGGHLDYWGNQAIKITLSVDAPTWAQDAPISDVSQVVGNVGYYSDGRPSSSQSYWGSQFIEQRDRAMRFGGVVYGTGGFARGEVNGFNTLTGLYEPAGTYPSLPRSPNVDQPGAKDPATEDFYLVSDGGDVLCQWKQATNRWKTFGLGVPLIAAHMAIDSRRRRIFCPNVYFGGGITDSGTIDLDVATPAVTRRTCTGDTSFIPANVVAGTGIVFVPHPTDPTQDCFLLRKRLQTGGGLIRVNASTFFIDALSTTGGAAIPSEATDSGGPYTKLITIPGLNGVAYMTDIDKNIWFLRTS